MSPRWFKSLKSWGLWESSWDLEPWWQHMKKKIKAWHHVVGSESLKKVSRRYWWKCSSVAVTLQHFGDASTVGRTTKDSSSCEKSQSELVRGRSSVCCEWQSSTSGASQACEDHKWVPSVWCRTFYKAELWFSCTVICVLLLASWSKKYVTYFLFYTAPVKRLAVLKRWM